MAHARHIQDRSPQKDHLCGEESSIYEAEALDPKNTFKNLLQVTLSRFSLTAVDGIPSTRIMRRNFLTPSSMSPDERDLEDSLGWLRILLNEWEVAEDMAVVSRCCPTGRSPVPLPVTSSLEVVSSDQKTSSTWTFPSHRLARLADSTMSSFVKWRMPARPTWPISTC